MNGLGYIQFCNEETLSSFWNISSPQGSVACNEYCLTLEAHLQVTTLLPRDDDGDSRCVEQGEGVHGKEGTGKTTFLIRSTNNER